MTSNIELKKNDILVSESFGTLVNLARQRALKKRDYVGYVYLQDGETPSDQLTYGDLDSRARAIAARLQEECATGDRVLLIYPPGLEFLCAFFGCLYAGCIAIPAYPPRRNRHDARLEGIVVDATPELVLTTTNIIDTCGNNDKNKGALFVVPWLGTDSIEISEGTKWQEYKPAPESTAFIQYTSGSTSQPKGVIVSHFNLLHNMEDMHQGCGHDDNSVMVTWLPIHHDLGLIYGALQPLYRGFKCYMMPPASFLQRPLRWLEAISRFRGTHSAAPNFAFDLCVRGIELEQVTSLDLSSMRMVLNAAEPIRAESIQRFFTHFASAGFNPTALSGGYGLAEATLKVATVPAGLETLVCSFDSEALEHNRVVDGDVTRPSWNLVGCGRTESDTEYIIVDPETRLQCAVDEVGEIWVKGPTIAGGYLNRPGDTNTTFNATLTGCGSGPYLRTGDLGFVYRDNLFITGRLKDMIIVRGMNHYPHDIELTVEKACPELRSGCGAAFSIDQDGQERLVVVYELDRRFLRTPNTHEIMVRIKEVVAFEHGIAVHSVSLIRTNTILKTTSGKIQRRACRQLFLDNKLTQVATLRPSDSGTPAVSERGTEKKAYGSSELLSMLLDAAAFHLRKKVNDIDLEEPLAHYGLDSAAAIAITGEIGRLVGKSCSPTILYERATIASLLDYLLGLDSSSAPQGGASLKSQSVNVNNSDSAIAVVGMGCRFPGAKSPKEFWDLLKGGKIVTSEIPSERWIIDEYYDAKDTPGMMSTRWGGFLEKIDQFDAGFFGIAPREADYMDPQHRLLLEISWEALENGGICPSSLRGTDSGVFIGISGQDYLQLQTEDIGSITAYTGTGGALSIAANRLSYFLNLNGPSLAIDTACSSSLVAVHQAITSLRGGECNLALAGGVNAILTPHMTVGLSKAKMMSGDGRCRVFDASANGYVRGEGCGVVVLKRLSDAVADNNRIHAVLRGSAVRQDGRSNGLTAPNRLAQESVIRAALHDANLLPSAVSFVEAHGTGTALGDPIEVEAIRNVYSDRKPGNRCSIGSVKANIGHLESAAGMASLIKTILSMRNEIIPGNTRLHTLNPLIQLGDTEVSISPVAVPWPRVAGARMAGVSSFGFGGTIAHTVVSEFTKDIEIPSSTPAHEICTLSAKSSHALYCVADELSHHLQTTQELSLQDICFTRNLGRDHFEYKLAVVANTTEELVAKLEEVKKQGPKGVNLRPDHRGKIVFLFSGQGGQLEGVARELLRTESVFRRCVEQCDVILKEELDISVAAIIEQQPDSTDPGLPTHVQPVLFTLQYALARQWQSWGIIPAAVMGHSLGEYAAACIAGIMSFEDALKLVVHRARLAEALPVWGSMVAVFADLTTVNSALEGSECEVAAINGPEHIIVSGTDAAISTLVKSLDKVGLRSVQLKATHGFHSACVEPMLNAFDEVAKTITFSEARITMYSTLTGKQAGEEIARADYWRRHLRQPVQFQSAMSCLVKDATLEDTENVFMEIGTSPTLIGMARKFAHEKGAVWISSLRKNVNDQQSMLEGLAQLYALGHPVDWSGFSIGRACNIVDLPTYSFQRKRHWLAPPEGHQKSKITLEHPLLGNRLNLAQSDGRFVWENSFLGVTDCSYLKDHVVNGVVVFPGAAFTEMIASAVRSLGLTDCIDILDLEFILPLVFDGSVYHCLQTVITRKEDIFECAIYSHESEAKADENWSQHVRCKVTGNEFLGKTVAIADCDNRSPRFMDGSDFYDNWESRGNDWGPSFQSVKHLKIGDFELTAVLKETPEVAREASAYIVHPALLDACVQTMAGGAVGVGAFVGKRVGRLHIAGPLQGELTAHVRWAESGPRSLVGDVTVMDEQGCAQLIVQDLTFTFLNNESDERWQDWLYTEEWELFQLPEPIEQEVAATWLVVGQQCDVATNCVASLRDMGHSVYHLSLEDSSVSYDFPKNVQGIVYFAPDFSMNQSEVCNPDGMIKAIVSQLLDASTMVAHTLRKEPFKTAKIWFVTQNSMPGMKFPQPASVLWGLYSGISAEHSGNCGGLIDIEEGTDPTMSGSLISQAITRLSHCDKLKIGRDITTPRLRAMTLPASVQETNIRTNGAYLITGGFGQLGSAIALWLLGQGARHIILLGRSTPSEKLQDTGSDDARTHENSKYLEQLEHGGVQVTTVALDISDVNGLKSWEEEYKRNTNIPIIGVFHAAGVVAKEAATEISEEVCLSMIRAKAGGIMAMEQVFDLHSMDFVVLFSSASTIVNSPFLGGYAAANAFLDSYAQQRRQQGFPITSIDWGTFKGRGMAAVAEQTGEASFSKVLQPIHIADGMEILARLLCNSTARVAVLPIDWDKWRAAYPSQAEHTYWDHVLTGDIGQGKDSGLLPARGELLASSDAKRHVLLVRGLTGLVGIALGADRDGVDSNRPLTALGIDSLMALEIRAALEKAYSVSLPVVTIISGPSIELLAQSLGELLDNQAEQTQPETHTDTTIESSTSIRDNQNEIGRFPLSFNQYSQWLLYNISPDVCAYHVSFSARVASPLDNKMLHGCLELLVQRHPSLRTTFSVNNGEIFQEIHAVGDIPLVEVDASGWSDEELYEEAGRAYGQSFDLASGPLIRAHLFSRSPSDHVLLLVVHHIACDGWSLWLLLEELSVLYAAETQISHARLPEIAASYLTYTRRQLAKWAKEKELRAGRDFWHQRLGTFPLVLELETDFPRPVTQSLNGSSIPVSISAELTKKLKRMASEHNTTMFTLLMAAYQVLLHRISNQPKLLVGSPTAGRTDSDISRTVGHFVNMIVIRGDLSENPPWCDFVETMRQEIIESFEHQDFPFHLLVENLQPERSPGRTPIFQVDFTYQRAHTNRELIDFMGGTSGDTRLTWGPLELSPFIVPQQEGQFDLSLEMAEGTESLFGFLKYNSDLFSPETITNLAQSFRMILESVCDTPELPVSEIPLLDAHQRRTVKKWAQSTTRALPDVCLHELFAEQASTIPDKQAVVCGAQTLSYRQLDERSDTIAWRLKDLGVGPDSIVGVTLERSTDLIASMLGILKAGGAYLMLDVSHPASRRKEMILDSGAEVLIGAATDISTLPGVIVCDLTELEMQGDCFDTVDETRPENLAYLIYTSGSTGKPKGVMIEHRSVVNLITGLQDSIYARYERAQQVSLFASTVFDASVQQIFGALCYGHTLHVLTDECRRDGKRLLDYWRRARVTISDATPTLLGMLLNTGLAEAEGLSLKHLIVGGEPLSREILSRLNSGFGRQINITNIYGPSECCVDVTAMELDVAHLPDTPVMPIGRPMLNIQAYILDHNKKPVIPGMVGELYIGGPNVGRGYLNREELTAESFIMNPFDQEERLYRTGDRVRFMATGDIAFLGRCDNQVKLRGYRIEPGEIEYRLRSCEGVQQAVVVVREDIPGDKRLVAYLVIEGEDLSKEKLRAQLICDLPEYMVPSTFMVLSSLPLNLSGKLDRSKLPNPADGAVMVHSVSAKPQTNFEREVAAIWKDIIGLREVGLHDNFFDLGGNSLLLIKVQIRLQAALARQVSITDLFRFPTIYSLAEFYGKVDGSDRDVEQNRLEEKNNPQQQKRRATGRGSLRRSHRKSIMETEI